MIRPPVVLKQRALDRTGHIVQDPLLIVVGTAFQNERVRFISTVDNCFHLSQSGYRAELGSSSKCP